MVASNSLCISKFQMDFGFVHSKPTSLFNWTHLKANIAFIDTVFQVKEAKINMLLYVNSFEYIQMDLVLPVLPTISFICRVIKYADTTS